MATEILGFLIIVGILIVFIVRRDLWNGSSSKADEVEEASMKMRLQMEHTMNTLITQMDSRIHQIEGLVAAADERARALEQQLASVREEQESTQRRAEQEFAAMRAERAMYYAPPEEMPRQYEGARDARQTWENYRRARAEAQERSLRPIEGVTSVHRAAYAAPVRQNRRVEAETFADTLSASMHTAGMPYDGAIPRERPAYYEPAQNMGYAQETDYRRNTRYEDRGYQETYAPGSYSVESYPEEEVWEQYATTEAPRPVSRASRRAAAPRQVQEIPVEMAVEETPAVIVAPSLAPRRDVYEHEEEEEENRTFSQEQLEELANTEAEVVVSSSVADVVDLPIDADEAEETAYDEEPDEDVHAFAEPEETPTPVTAEEDSDEENEDAPQEMAVTSNISHEPEETRDTLEEETEAEDKEEDAETEAEYDASLIASEWPEGIEIVDEEPDEPETSMQSVEPGLQDEAESASSAAPEESEEEPEAEETAPAESQDDILFDALDMKIEEAAAEEPARERHAVADDDIRPPSPAVRAREMLASGMSIDEVTRETGMGRSAVDLLAQMAAGSQEKTKADD